MYKIFVLLQELSFETEKYPHNLTFGALSYVSIMYTHRRESFEALSRWPVSQPCAFFIKLFSFYTFSAHLSYIISKQDFYLKIKWLFVIIFIIYITFHYEDMH